jgi:hypothetical protein
VRQMREPVRFQRGLGGVAGRAGASCSRSVRQALSSLAANTGSWASRGGLAPRGAGRVAGRGIRPARHGPALDRASHRLERPARRSARRTSACPPIPSSGSASGWTSSRQRRRPSPRVFRGAR